MFLSFILAFGFAKLAMLGWLAAAAAPLVIHLWSRHQHREAPWAAMQFLLAALQKNSRRLQLQQWLLLLVRTLIIVLVVLAVAEPYGERFMAGGSGAPAHKVLVLDGSYSMAYRDGGASLFNRAKQLAVSLVSGSRAGDSFTVILMTTPARTILDRKVVAHSAIEAEIESLEQLHTGADLAGALALVQKALARESEDSARIARQKVYFLTDLQRSTWAPNSQSDGSPANKEFAALAEAAELHVIDVGQPAAENLAITSIVTEEPFVTIGHETEFVVSLRQFGDQPRDDCAVELLIDEVPVAEKVVDISAGGQADVRFTYRFQSPDDHVVLTRATSDDLIVDNSRRLVVPVREELRVLCVAGRQGAARYVASALRPSADSGSAIRPIVISEGELADANLSDFDCVFLCNVAQFTPSEAERLRRYVLNGGGIVFFLGDRVVPENYNLLAQYASNDSPGGWGRAPASPPRATNPAMSPLNDSSNDSNQHPLLPARLAQLVTEPQFGIDPLDYRHPIVAPFRDRERAGLLTTPVTRYYRLEMANDRAGVDVAAAIPGGDPFIVTTPLGHGRIILVATAGSLASVDAATGQPWTNWPTWPSFLPIVREMLAYAVSGEQHDWQQLVGTPLGGTFPPNQAPANRPPRLEIEQPDGRIDPVALRSTPAGWEWHYDATDMSGIYSLRGLAADEPQPFAVNVDTDESDLARAEPQNLPPQLSVAGAIRQSADEGTHLYESRAAWSELLLWLCLALLLIESFLAWLFGRGIL